MTFVGVVVNGFGKAAGFTELAFYKRQFVKKLGFKPFPGTLNLRVEPKVKREIKKQKTIRITGRNGRGSAKCFAIKIKDLPCFAIIPTKSTHGKNVLEVLSKFNLRKKLHLRSGCRIKLSGYGKVT